MNKQFNFESITTSIFNLISIGTFILYPFSYLLHYFFKRGYYSVFSIDYILPENFINSITIVFYTFLTILAIIIFWNGMHFIFIKYKFKFHYFLISAILTNLFSLFLLNIIFLFSINIYFSLQYNLLDIISSFYILEIVPFIYFTVFSFSKWFTRKAERKSILKSQKICSQSFTHKKGNKFKLESAKKGKCKIYFNQLKNIFKHGDFSIKQIITHNNKKYILKKKPYYHLSLYKHSNLNTRTRFLIVLPILVILFFVILTSIYGLSFSIGQSSHYMRTSYTTVIYKEKTYFVVDENDNNFLIMPLNNSVITYDNYHIIEKTDVKITRYTNITQIPTVHKSK